MCIQSVLVGPLLSCSVSLSVCCCCCCYCCAWYAVVLVIFVTRQLEKSGYTRQVQSGSWSFLALPERCSQVARANWLYQAGVARQLEQSGSTKRCSQVAGAVWLYQAGAARQLEQSGSTRQMQSTLLLLLQRFKDSMSLFGHCRQTEFKLFICLYHSQEIYFC